MQNVTEFRLDPPNGADANQPMNLLFEVAVLPHGESNTRIDGHFHKLND
jgi:hypothetical protein